MEEMTAAFLCGGSLSHYPPLVEDDVRKFKTFAARLRYRVVKFGFPMSSVSGLLPTLLRDLTQRSEAFMPGQHILEPGVASAGGGLSATTGRSTVFCVRGGAR